MQTYFFREKKERNYTTLDNTFLKDKRLSAKAKWLFAYLLMLPEDWKIYISELVNNFSDWETSIRNWIKELQKFWYIKIEKIRNNKWQFIATAYYIIETPNTENPDVENPNMDEQDVENQWLQSTYNTKYWILQNTYNNKDIYSIFDFWNSFDIIKHKKLNPVIENTIKKALKDFEVDEIKKWIENYAKILKSPETFFKYKWTLNEFLSRKNWLSVFLYKNIDDYKTNNWTWKNNFEDYDNKDFLSWL